METYAYQDFKVKLFPKKLGSGKCQVKFFVSLPQCKDIYGYLLVNPEASLKDVVHKIKCQICRYKSPECYYQESLYSIRKEKEDVCFMLFDGRG